MKSRLVNDRYTLIVPDHVADWDAPSEWERARFLHMEANLTRDDILIDVGAEHGWISAIYATWIGGDHMILCEPTCAPWGNIRATWEANDLAIPLACWQGLVGSNDRMGKGTFVAGGWPACADTGETGKSGYAYLHDDSGADIAAITLDSLCGTFNLAPTALTIDVEGAEYEVLFSAREMMMNVTKVWVSIHPDLLERDYNTTPDAILDLMEARGYTHTHLGTDHEEHHFFSRQP